MGRPFMARLLLFQIWFFHIRVSLLLTIIITLVCAFVPKPGLWFTFCITGDLLLLLALLSSSCTKLEYELKSCLFFGNVWSNAALAFSYWLHWHLNNIMIKRENSYSMLPVHSCSSKNVILFKLYKNLGAPTCYHVIWFVNQNDRRWFLTIRHHTPFHSGHLGPELTVMGLALS